MKDGFGREINYMRISITDRCNLRCRYCMPEGISCVEMEEILTFEEIEQTVRAAIRAGITRFKITGGEPLVRRDCAELIAKLLQIPGTEEVTLTTNGVLLEQEIPKLWAAGLRAVNISLDTLRRTRYRELTGFDRLEQVKAGVEAAVDVGMKVKINVVLQKGYNDDEWKALAELAKTLPVDVRFIELMPIGSGKMLPVVYHEEILKKLQEAYEGVEQDLSHHGNGPAVYYRIPGFRGSVGFISAMHGKFCEHCNRIRLTAKGQLKACLCYGETLDIRQILRKEGTPEEMEEAVYQAIVAAVEKKPKQHCFEQLDEITEDRKMAQIGG